MMRTMEQILNNRWDWNELYERLFDCHKYQRGQNRPSFL